MTTVRRWGFAATGAAIALAASACAADRSAPPLPDAALGAQLASVIFDSLHGQRTQQSVAWIAADTLSWHALRDAASKRGNTLQPPDSADVFCPWSVDSSNVKTRNRVGYSVWIGTAFRDNGTLVVSATIECTHPRGVARGYGSGRTWAAKKTWRGWRLRVIDHFVT